MGAVLLGPEESTSPFRVPTEISLLDEGDSPFFLLFVLLGP